jgi:hypothetical protein
VFELMPLHLFLCTLMCVVRMLYAMPYVMFAQYYEMVCKGKSEGIGKAVAKNVGVSALERAHDEKSETLARVLPSSQTDPAVRKHVAGLLYYQVNEA